jgi:hypothetical protein
MNFNEKKAIVENAPSWATDYARTTDGDFVYAFRVCGAFKNKQTGIFYDIEKINCEVISFVSYVTVEIDTLKAEIRSHIPRKNNMPKMIPVTSSNLKAVAYKDNTLYVQFKGGKTFSYEGVSEEACNEFIKSASVGSFFARNIRKSFKATEVKDNE